MSAAVPRVVPAAASARPTRAVTLEGLAHLLVVYLVWGSTYLAIRIAVREGSGFPPFTMSATRILLAGGVLLVWARLTGQRVRPTRRELGTLALVGALLWLGGNGALVWAEQRADSGYAALLVTTTPIWVVAIAAVLDRQAPSALLILALVLGLAGVGLLSAPVLAAGSPADVLTVAALVLASVTWAAGTVLQQRRPLELSPAVSSGYQLFLGGVSLELAVLLTREPLPAPAADALAAWLYLACVGSLLGFTSFVQILRLLPSSVAMTYAYVNPVIAVLLGAVVLAEPITPFSLVGMALVLLGVAGVFHLRGRGGAR